MHALAVVAYSAFLMHFCATAAAAEDERFDSEFVVCLAAVAVEMVLPGSELVPDSEELLVSMVDSYCLDSVIVGNLEWHGPSPHI